MFQWLLPKENDDKIRGDWTAIQCLNLPPYLYRHNLEAELQ